MGKRITSSRTKENQLAFAKAFADLKKDITERRILDRDYGWYILHILINTIGSVIGFYMLIVGSWILAAFFIAFFTVQWGGLVHDAGHLAITKNKKWNYMIGRAISTFLGSGFAGWNYYHNNHHNHVNEEEEDMDLMLPVLSYTKERAATKTGWEKSILPYQHFFYGFLFSFASISLRLTQGKYIFKNRLWLEFFILILGNIFWFVMPVFIFGKVGLAFILLSQFLAGQYFARVFAPNHKGMPELAAGVKMSYLEQQVVTARNLPSHWLIDYVYLGLNYQIEHHLFPHCSRRNQPKLAKIVRPFCEKMGLSYTEIKPWEVDRTLFLELREIARLY